jgi:hypothetical protein
MIIDIDKQGPLRLDHTFLDGYRKRPVDWGGGPLFRVAEQITAAHHAELMATIKPLDATLAHEHQLASPFCDGECERPDQLTRIESHDSRE